MRRLCACYLLCWACLLLARAGQAVCPAGTPSAAPLSAYGPEAGDTALTVTSSHTLSAGIELPKPFVYANKEFSNVYVGASGVVYLEMPPAGQATPVELPSARLLVAAYWKQVAVGDGAPTVYYRNTTSATELAAASAKLRSNFATPLKFAAHVAVVVTWVNVTHAAGDCKDTMSTFQAVLLTDGLYSFVTLNYASLVGTDESGTAPNPLAGINAGMDQSYSLPGSGFFNVTDLVTSSNVDVHGVWTFRVDTQPFVTTLCDDTGALSLAPPMASPQGGTHVQLSGPCLTAGMSLKVKVDGVEVPVTYRAPHSAWVVMPTFWKLSMVSVQLSADGGSTYPHSAPLILGTDATAVPMVTRTSEETWNLKTDGNLIVTWDPDVIEGNMISIFFVSYKYNSSGELDELLFPLAVDQMNNGSFALDINGLPLVSNETLQLITFGSVLIKASNGLSTVGEVCLYSDVHVAVWFVRNFIIELAVRNRMRRVAGDSDVTYLQAALWNSMTTSVHIFEDTVEAIKMKLKMRTMSACPLWKSILDRIGEEMCAEVSAVQMRRAGPCSFRQAASDPAWAGYTVRWSGRGCVNSATITDCVIQTFPDAMGASQKACYNSEGFMQEGVTTARPVAAHPDGLVVGGVVKKRWVVDHFLQDVQPLMFCCVWSDVNCNAMYKTRRPAVECDAYRSPGLGGGGGDPHFVTFDDLKFTFNGIGEFLLVGHQDGFSVQARLQQRGTLPASQVTSMAMKTSASDNMEVRASSTSGLELLVAGVIQKSIRVSPVSFKAAKCYLRFDGPKVTSVEVVFVTGESVKVTQYDGALQYIILPLDTYKGTLIGLLGDYNGKKANDFTAPTGQGLNISSAPKGVHAYALQWQTMQAKSLFTYTDGTSHQSYMDPSFNATYPDPEMPMPTQCNGDKFCAYDMKVTGDLNFAMATKQLISQLLTIRENFDSGGNCLLLNAVFTSLDSIKTRVGSEVTVSCDEGYIDSATMRRAITLTCLANLTWNGEPVNCTKEVSPCEHTTCLHKGTCVLLNNAATCKCTSHFSGSRCQNAVSDSRLLIIVGSVIGGVLLVAIVAVVVLLCKTRPPIGDHHKADPFKDAFPDYDCRSGIPTFTGATKRQHYGEYGSRSYHPYRGERRDSNPVYRDWQHRYLESQRNARQDDRHGNDRHEPRHHDDGSADRSDRGDRDDPLPAGPYPHFGSSRGSDEDSIDQIYRGEVPAKYAAAEHPTPDYDGVDPGVAGGGGGGCGQDDYILSPPAQALNPNWVLKR